ncbi:hypothetical protein LTR12_018028, partial [Friedmanniomyces endolithicus]
MPPDRRHRPSDVNTSGDSAETPLRSSRRLADQPPESGGLPNNPRTPRTPRATAQSDPPTPTPRGGRNDSASITTHSYVLPEPSAATPQPTSTEEATSLSSQGGTSQAQEGSNDRPERPAGTRQQNDMPNDNTNNRPTTNEHGRWGFQTTVEDENADDFPQGVIQSDRPVATAREQAAATEHSAAASSAQPRRRQPSESTRAHPPREHAGQGPEPRFIPSEDLKSFVVETLSPRSRRNTFYADWQAAPDYTYVPLNIWLHIHEVLEALLSDPGPDSPVLSMLECLNGCAEIQTFDVRRSHHNPLIEYEGTPLARGFRRAREIFNEVQTLQGPGDNARITQAATDLQGISDSLVNYARERNFMPHPQQDMQWWSFGIELWNTRPEWPGLRFRPDAELLSPAAAPGTPPEPRATPSSDTSMPDVSPERSGTSTTSSLPGFRHVTRSRIAEGKVEFRPPGATTGVICEIIGHRRQGYGNQFILRAEAEPSDHHVIVRCSLFGRRALQEYISGDEAREAPFKSEPRSYLDNKFRSNMQGVASLYRDTQSRLARGLPFWTHEPVSLVKVSFDDDTSVWCKYSDLQHKFGQDVIAEDVRQWVAVVGQQEGPARRVSPSDRNTPAAESWSPTTGTIFTPPVTPNTRRFRSRQAGSQNQSNRNIAAQAANPTLNTP